MIIKSSAGTEIAKNGYTVIDELNQIPMIKTNYLQLEHNHINPIILGSKAFEYKDIFVNVVEDTETSGNTAFKEYNAIHEFAWILSGMRKHDSYTGYLSLEQYLTMVLEGTNFTYQVEGGHQYYALQFENLGDGESHLDMFFKMLNRWNTEFELRGKKVYITHQRGRLRDKHVGRYKMNIIDTIINSDITDGATAVWGYFGKKDEENPENSTYREFYWQIDELVEQYGIRYAKPYSNENITQEETMIEYLNNIILDSWKISTEVDIAEITDEVVQTGDEYVAVDERLGITLNTRIQKLESVYDADDNLLYQTATLGTVSFASAASGSSNQLQEVIEKVKKDYNDRITDLKQEFDNRFNDEVTQIEIDFNELINGVRREIKADKEAFELRYTQDKETLSGEIQNSYTNAVTEANRIVEVKETDFKNYADGIGNAANGRIDSLYDGLGDLSSEFENLDIGGRNLIVRTTETPNTWISLLGDVVPAPNHATSDYIKVEPNTEYMLTKSDSELATDAGFFRWGWYDVDMVYIDRTPNSNNEILWKTPNNAHYVRVSYPTDSSPKFEKGNKPTDWSPAPEDLMKYTDIIARPDGFLIGTFEMGGDKIAQAIVGKAGAIDLIADNVNFTGNVNVANQIKAYSLEAVYADIAKLRTNVLTANSVSATALKVDTALINKLNTNSILTNYLIANTAMIENIKSKSLEAVYADISELRTRLLVADVITANMVKFDTALIEKFTSSTAFINSLTSKQAFINTAKVTELISTDGRDSFTLAGGQMNWVRSNGQSMQLGIDGIYMRNSDGSTRFQLDRQMVTSAALGTSNANAYIGTQNGYEVRFVDATQLPSDGLVSSYRYSNARGRYGYFDGIAPNQGTHLWLGADGEVRISNKGFTTYNTLRTAGIYADFLEQNTLGNSAVNFYIRPRGGEIRFTSAGSTTSYADARMRTLITENSIVHQSATTTNVYFGTGGSELRITNNAGYNGGDTSYQDIRYKNAQLVGHIAHHGSSGWFYIGAGGTNGVRFTDNNWTDGGYKNIQFQEWKAWSAESAKTEIEKWNLNVLNIIKEELQLYRYKFKQNVGSEFSKFSHGIILRNNSNEDEFPVEWREEDSFNGNEVMWWNTKAIQELAHENDELKDRINDLENKLNKIMEMIA